MKKVITGPVVVVNNHTLNLPNSKKGLGHYLPLLEKTVEQLDAMLSYHCQVMVLRIDLRLYVGTTDNKPMSDFIRRLRKRLTSKGYKRVGYVWCREQQSSAAQHYHLAVIVDANKSRHPHNLIELIQYLWETWGHVKPYTPKNCYGVIKRGDDVAYEKQFCRLSYLAKVATKENREKTTNDYSASRIKPKKNNGNTKSNFGENMKKEASNNITNEIKSPKFVVKEGGGIQLNCSKEEQKEYYKRVTGSKDVGLAIHLVGQAANSFPKKQDMSVDYTCDAFNNAAKLIEGIGPKDTIEGMIAVQMVAIHGLTMENSKKASCGNVSAEVGQKYINNTMKLSRTFAAQMDALKKYRSGGAQKITVEHVTVESGGQAIVGSEITN